MQCNDNLFYSSIPLLGRGNYLDYLLFSRITIFSFADWGDEFFVWNRAVRGSKQKIHPWIKQRPIFR